ncbi:Fpg/Nei family DNA glycosylase [Microbacterium protaetiae]|uniref:Fpg/Nei family DNA glycosylase n=1 Tax=Microbacterium protaetiae TaxID=2509458 RepID=A0A4P6EIA4_9MICO|nr:DNA-formamidopyrimidine glycosylase family protein [Microbacterium protaetiae]QAY60979.1 Fpg/Nei family DNA glycosylase [Microbacterium protaetiae]
MPESPEVQALAEWLDEQVTGCRIREVDLIEFRAVKTRTRSLATLVGERIEGVRRVGKYLDVRLEREHLVVSLGRHGWVQWVAQGEPVVVDAQAPALASLTVDAGTILFTDAGTWVSLGLWVVDEPTNVSGVAKLGPDPLDPGFAQEAVDAAVAGRRKQLKAILQEQESFAGIGNAYSDEILHRARLSPVVHGDRLSARQRADLFTAMRDVLRDAAAARRGIPIDKLTQAKTDAMRVHGRGGTACPVCAGIVRDFRFGGTSAQYCPTCQTGGELLE